MSEEKEEEVKVTKPDVRVPMLGELDALAAELNEECKVCVSVSKHYHAYDSESDASLIVMLDGDNKLGKEIKERVEKFLGVKLKAEKEILKEGMIEFNYYIPGKLMVRIDRAMTCEKVGTEMKEVEYKVEISPGKEPVMKTEKKMVEVPVYKCTEADIEFKGEAK